MLNFSRHERNLLLEVLPRLMRGLTTEMTHTDMEDQRDALRYQYRILAQVVRKLDRHGEQPQELDEAVSLERER